jgi:hypothetical protein
MNDTEIAFLVVGILSIFIGIPTILICSCNKYNNKYNNKYKPISRKNYEKINDNTNDNTSEIIQV